MKNWLTALAILVVITAGFYGVTYFAIIPQMARVLVPDKWKSLVINQRQDAYQAYLGKPVSQNNQTDHWQVRNGHYQYFLSIEYNGQDSVSEKFLVTYRFKNWLFEKQGSLQGDSTVR